MVLHSLWSGLVSVLSFVVDMRRWSQKYEFRCERVEEWGNRLYIVFQVTWYMSSFKVNYPILSGYENQFRVLNLVGRSGTLIEDPMCTSVSLLPLIESVSSLVLRP